MTVQARKFLLVGAVICLTFVFSATAFGDATGGGLFVSSDTNNANFLVLKFSDGSTQTLDTKFHAINACGGLGCTLGSSANQGWWSISDRVQTNDNPNYRTGVSTVGDKYRDFFTFDLNQATAPAAGITLVGATLEVQRFGSDPASGGAIGLNIGIVGGNDASGVQITAERLNDKADDLDATNMFNAIGNATHSTAFKVPTSGDPNDLLAFDLSAIVSSINLGSTAFRNWFSLGGTTFDIGNQTGLPEPTIVPPAAVPEPASLLLLASGLSGAWLRRRKK